MLYRFSPWIPGFLLSLALLSVPAFSATSPGTVAQPPTATVPSREHTLEAQSFVNERLSVWQKRLNLQDWNISVLMSRTSGLKPRTLGNIHWDATRKSAVIRVLDPADYHMPFDDMLKDMEFTVVHELIHLEISSLPRSEASRGEEEHAVNQIAQALLDLDRKK